MLDLQLLQHYDGAVPDRVVSLNVSADLNRIQLGNSYGDLRSITVGQPDFSEVHVSSHPLANIVGDTVVRDANGTMFLLSVKGQNQLAADKMFSGKNVSCVASDDADRIAITTKKHIRVLRRSGPKSWARTHEIDLSSRATPMLMVFADDMICLGTPSQYSIYRLRMEGSMSIIDLDHVPVSGIIPACEIIPESQQIVLSTNSRLGIFVSYDGMPVPGRFPLEWSSAPLALRLCGSCIIALLPAGRLEIFTIAQSHLVQTLILGADCVISSRSFVSAGFAVVDQHHLYLARPMSFEDQIAYHVRSLNVHAAEAILWSMSPSPEMLDALNMRLAKGLIHHLLFQEAFDRLEALLTSVQPEILLQMLPIFGSSLSQPTPNALELLIDNGRVAIMQNLDQIVLHDRDKVQLVSLAKKETKVLVNEVHRLLASYLQRRKGSYEAIDAVTTVDTILVYLAVSLPAEQVPFTLEQLLLPSNNCHSQFCEEFLRGNFPDVYALVLRSQQRYNEALQIWSQSRTGFALTSSIALLTALNADDELIYRYAEWIFEYDRKQAPVIFLRCKTERVIIYLQQLANSTSFVIAYLEYLINEDGCMVESIHTLLARMYLRDNERSLRNLLDFLNKSTVYNAAELLTDIQSSDLPLIEEQIVVLSRLGAHDQVQRLFLKDLNDIEGAVRYTESLRDPTAIVGLARQLFDPSSELDLDRSELQEMGVNILCRHCRDVDPVAALSLLPTDMPLVSILSLLSRVVNCTNSKRRLTQIELSLHSIERFRSEKSLFEHQSRCVRIETSSLCRVCHQPIAGKPFSMYGSRLFHNQCR